MKCIECRKPEMKPAYWQYRDQIADDKKAYFPQTWWVRTSAHTWKEMQPYICTNCGSVRANFTGRTASAKKEVDDD